MEKGILRSRWGGLPVAAVVVLLFGAAALGLEELLDKPVEDRSDLIVIDSMATLGTLERPPVPFLHDKHTEALEKRGKDCAACHLRDEKRQSPKFMRLKDADYESVMNVYHDNCIVCHREISDAGEKSGPVTCGDCHTKTIPVATGRQPMGFDLSLHYRHSKAQDKKCETCHHEYDEATKKLVYVKEQEGTCRYCHKAQTEENRISMRLASHLSCIECHQKTMAKNKIAGPVHCGGCHDLSEQQKIERVNPVPRMERKQPDVIFVKSSNPEINEKDRRINRVPFDHKRHETYSSTCRVCHHAAMSACAACHTQSGKKEGKGVKLAEAMHQIGTETSCMGCHQLQQRRHSSCAGCHVSIPANRQRSEAECLTCHMPPLTEEAQTAAAGQSGTDPFAAELLASRTPVTDTYGDEDVPEKVIINVLVDQYEPVELPHRKIVRTLVKNIRESKLAAYYHREEGTLCQGCHHNSPVSKKPPQCASCHGKPFDEKQPERPGLKAAYHQQCMTCHEAMGIEKPAAVDCVGCHKERKK